jgi:glycosyltransferase involved in cell wall biosynthesis
VRRLLVLAYNFPPAGGSGVQHAVGLVHRLPALGWEPVVVTAPEDARHDATDETLTVPDGVDVHRIPGPEPASDGWAQRRFMLPSAWERWWVDGVVATAPTTDAVYAWMQPYATAEAAARLGRRWVADLSDPWALDEMWSFATAVHRRRELRRMRRLLGTAAAVVMSTPEAAKRVREAFPEFPRVVSIPYGYDAATFAGPPPARSDAAFRIVHTGVFHTAQGLRQRRHRRLRRLLGGEPVPGVDVLSRSPVYLLRALERLESPLRDRVELHIAGPLTAADCGVLAGSPFVRSHGYLPHAESVALARSADLLFLPMQDVPGRAGLVPGKTYEYLASGRSILAAIPEGDARDLLLEAGARVVSPTDVDGMTRAIRAVAAGDARPVIEPTVLRPYEYHSVARELVAVLDEAF